MKIVLDAMGSDSYPEPELQAAVSAAETFGEEILLVGKETLLAPKLSAINPRNLPVRIINAPDVLEMDEKPVEAARRKPRNSMAVGLELVKSGEAQAFVSAGNTGGVMFNAIRTLRRIEGVERPAMSVLFPVKNGQAVVLDTGANADCRPEFLLQFAVMGSVYAQKMLGIERPRVGLLSNGEEAGKGNDLIKHTHPLLQQSGLNFAGNVEAKELFGGAVDVVVTDGFTGNVLLKSSEAVARFLLETIKTQLTSTTIAKLGAAIVKPYLMNVKKLMDPSEIGAAPMLGVDGLVLVGHGRSDARALFSAIRVARQLVQADLISALRLAIKENLAQVQAASQAQGNSQ
jgi:glycerol-3-phosphate acyltransferase PlsX